MTKITSLKAAAELEDQMRSFLYNPEDAKRGKQQLAKLGLLKACEKLSDAKFKQMLKKETERYEKAAYRYTAFKAYYRGRQFGPGGSKEAEYQAITEYRKAAAAKQVTRLAKKILSNMTPKEKATLTKQLRAKQANGSTPATELR